AHSVPTHNGLRPDDGYGAENARAATIEPDEQSTVDPPQMWSMCRLPLQNIELMTQYYEPASSCCRGLNQSHSIRTSCRPIAIIWRSCSDSPGSASQTDEVLGSDRGNLHAIDFAFDYFRRSHQEPWLGNGRRPPAIRPYPRDHPGKPRLQD